MAGVTPNSFLGGARYRHALEEQVASQPPGGWIQKMNYSLFLLYASLKE